MAKEHYLDRARAARQQRKLKRQLDTTSLDEGRSAAKTLIPEQEPVAPSQLDAPAIDISQQPVRPKSVGGPSFQPPVKPSSVGGPSFQPPFRPSQTDAPAIDISQPPVKPRSVGGSLPGDFQPPTLNPTQPVSPNAPPNAPGGQNNDLIAAITTLLKSQTQEIIQSLEKTIKESGGMQQ